MVSSIVYGPREHHDVKCTEEQSIQETERMGPELGTIFRAAPPPTLFPTGLFHPAMSYLQNFLLSPKIVPPTGNTCSLCKPVGDISYSDHNGTYPIRERRHES